VFYCRLDVTGGWHGGLQRHAKYQANSHQHQSERSGEREQKTVDECDMMHMIERGESAKQGNPFLRKEGRKQRSNTKRKHSMSQKNVKSCFIFLAHRTTHPTMMLPIKQLIKILLLLSISAIVGSAGVAAFIGGKSTIGWQHSTQNHKQHIIILPSLSCPSNTKRAHLTMQASLPMDDPRVEPRAMYKIDISLPLGLTLEEMDSDPSCGVVVVGISPEGNAGEATLCHVRNQNSIIITNNRIIATSALLS